MDKIKENDNFYKLKKLYGLLNTVEKSNIQHYISNNLNVRTVIGNEASENYTIFERSIENQINKLLNGDV